MRSNNVVTYNSIINANARCGGIDRAEELFRQMDAEGIAPGVATFNSLINVSWPDLPQFCFSLFI